MPNTIAILAPSAVPFEVGGAEKFWWGLRNALACHGDYFVDLIKLPCREKSFEEVIASYEAFSLLDLSHFDMLVTTKYPAWIAHHPNHVCYLQHTLRGLYDTYASTGLPETLDRAPAQLADLVARIRRPDPGRADLPDVFDLCRRAIGCRSLDPRYLAFPGPLIREIVHFLDRVALSPREIRAYLAISGNVASRRDYLPAGVPVKILPHPSDLDGFHCARGQYFFTASRLHSNKRIRLVADAMRHVPLDIPLKIAGTGPELNMLRERFAGDRRIEFLGFVPDDRLVDLYAGAICVPYAPIDEDYGLITIEAMKSGKPVVTTPDSGGVCEFVEHEKTGLVVGPYPPDFGAAMTRLARDSALAAALGENARKKVAAINWPENVAALLAHAAAPSGRSKPVVLVCAPFAPAADGAGGPRRLAHFCRQLASRFAVRVICYGSQTQASTAVDAALPGMSIISLPWPEIFLRTARRIADETGQSSDDIAILRHCADDGNLRSALLEYGADAVCCALSHPWLYPAVGAFLPDLPIVYDAHNVEADMKETVYGPGAIAVEVEEVEMRLCRKARRVFACSLGDSARLARMYGLPSGRVVLMPNGCVAPAPVCDKKSLRRRLAFPGQPMAIFVGSDHRPNVEAALAIFAMARELPEAQFLLVGSVCWPPAVARVPRPENIHLLGPLSEKLKNILLQRADIALNPVTSGSGVNLKVAEYLANGLVCLSTPFGSRGMPEQLEPALQIAELEDFPARIRTILARPPVPELLAGIAGKIAAQFEWKTTFSGLCQKLAEAVSRESDAFAD